LHRTLEEDGRNLCRFMIAEDLLESNSRIAWSLFSKRLVHTNVSK
jgi:hypothetical protein